MRYFLDKVHELATKGFVVEILADGWGNWKFKEDGRPDYSTATPAPEDDGNICWRGCYWYFSLETNKLVYDDIGCFSLKNGGAETAMQKLIDAYEVFKEDINPKGFNL